jgi:VanZ family protein
MNKRRILIIVIIVLLLATVCFIWGNSLESVAESDSKSTGVLDFLTPLLEIVVGRGNVTNHLVRKLAHFSEFGALGAELALLAVLLRRVKPQPVINCLFAALAVAVTDEALQLLTAGRGSQVSDVLLDFSGSVTGILLVLLIYAASRLITRKRT